LISEIASATILKQDFDFITVTDQVTAVGPSVFDLILLREKNYIGVSAPITLNINNGSASIHGTVTGDPVNIGLFSGTVPILL
jgi:hypothetical protein